MSMIESKTVIGATRRQILGRAAVAAGLAGAVSAGLTHQAVAEAVKLRPGDIGYQTSPKGNARCELCANWQAPNACKVVSGTISPTGWCSLFVHKS